MRAIVLPQYGLAHACTKQVLIPRLPRESINRVVVKVSHVSLSSGDIALAEGEMQDMYFPDMPFVLGTEFCGTIVESKDTSFHRGQKVFGLTHPMYSGAFAEYVSLPSYQIAEANPLIPESLLSCTPLMGLEAFQALRMAGLLESPNGKRVLVLGDTLNALFAHKVIESVGCSSDRRTAVDESIEGVFDLVFDCGEIDQWKEAERVVHEKGAYVTLPRGMSIVQVAFEGLGSTWRSMFSNKQKRPQNVHVDYYANDDLRAISDIVKDWKTFPFDIETLDSLESLGDRLKSSDVSLTSRITANVG